MVPQPVLAVILLFPLEAVAAGTGAGKGGDLSVMPTAGVQSGKGVGMEAKGKVHSCSHAAHRPMQEEPAPPRRPWTARTT